MTTGPAAVRQAASGRLLAIRGRCAAPCHLIGTTMTNDLVVQLHPTDQVVL